MRRTALLCWEAGSGYGHAVALLQIARRLEARGWTPVVALQSPRSLHDLDTSNITTCVAPRWGDGGPLLERSTRSTASLGDALAQIGLQSADWVKRQIGRWRALFEEHRPDVVVADYAPGAVLAARDHIPCIACGVGFTVPPATMRSFPPLHDGSPPIYVEADICAAVNSALAEHDTPPIAFLPEALTGDAQCVCTLPLLDPYNYFRREPVFGPQLNAPIVRRDREANEIFCYLREAPGSDRLASLVDCLLALPNPVNAFIPGLPEAAKIRLSRGDVTVLDRPAPLAAQLKRCRLVVHFGGHGIAASALLAGVPQIIVNFDIEKSLIAKALEQRGVARRFDYYQEPVELGSRGNSKGATRPGAIIRGKPRGGRVRQISRPRRRIGDRHRL